MPRSALTLLVARVGADNANHALALDDLAVAAHLFNRGADFHALSPKLKHRSARHARAADTLQICLLHQALVLVRHHVRLHLGRELAANPLLDYAFLNLEQEYNLQSALDLAEVSPTRRFPRGSTCSPRNWSNAIWGPTSPEWALNWKT